MTFSELAGAVGWALPTTDRQLTRNRWWAVPTLRNYPDGCGPWNWTMLQLSHPDDADALAAHIRDNEILELSNRISMQSTPPDNLSVILRAYFAAELNNDEQATAVALAKIRKRLPLDR